MAREPTCCHRPRNAPRLNTKAWYIASTASRDRFAAFGACWCESAYCPDILVQAAAAIALECLQPRVAGEIAYSGSTGHCQGRRTIDELMDTLRKLMRQPAAVQKKERNWAKQYQVTGAELRSAQRARGKGRIQGAGRNGLLVPSDQQHGNGAVLPVNRPS